MPWRHPDAPNWPLVRNPFEVGAGVFYVTVGFFGTIGINSPSVARVLSGPMLVIWLSGAILSGCAVLAAAVMVTRDYPLSMLLERAGMQGIRAFSTYLLVLILVGPTPAPITVVLLLIYIVASWVRCRQVREVVQWMKWISATPPAKRRLWLLPPGEVGGA